MATVTPQASMPSTGPIRTVRAALRLLLFASVWLGLNGTDAKSWLVGGPAVVGATWLSLRLLPPVAWRFSPGAAAAFILFFLKESLRGGWDVARRALSPGLPLSPGIQCFVPRLPAGIARWFFCNTVSLLPGTAVIAIEDHQLCVHVLEMKPEVEIELRDLERRVARLFKVSLGEEGPRVR